MVGLRYFNEFFGFFRSSDSAAGPPPYVSGPPAAAVPATGNLRHCTYLVRRLQSVLNAFAQMIFQLRRSDQITDSLASLHWLRVQERIQFKIVVLTYKVLHGTAPRNLGPLVRVSDLPGRRRLSSASTNRLVVSPFKLSTIGSRTFDVAAARTWNGRPEYVTSSPTLPAFRKRLETHLFRRSYPDIVP